jgi:hypothetical protein
MTDRVFWQTVYRALKMVCAAIEKRWGFGGSKPTGPREYKVEFTSEEVAFRSRELKPDPDQESPFVKLR